MSWALAKAAIVNGFLVGIFTGTVAAQQPIRSQLLVPDDLQLSIMIKTTLIAFNNANLTGNYSVLRDVAAPSFREANTQARLAEIFQKPRQDKLNIAPIVLYQPVLTRKPWINQRQLLRLQGAFDTRPERVNFNLAFSAVGNQWRLFAIGVTTEKPQVADAGDPNARSDNPTSAAKSEPKKRTIQPLPPQKPEAQKNREPAGN